MPQITFSSSRRSNQPITVGGRIFLSLFCLIFLAAGLAIAEQMLQQQATSLAARGWPTVECTILSGKVSDNSPYTCSLLYTYFVKDKRQKSTVIYPGYSGSDDYYDAQKILDAYPPGSKSVCLVNPANPADAVLRTQSLWNLLQLLFPMVFITIGAGGIILAWQPARPRSGPVVIKHPKVAMAMLFSVLVISGMIVLGFFVPLFLRWQSAQNWPTVSCNIIRSSVGRHTSHGKHGDSTTYSVDVLFKYTFDGKRHESSRYSLVRGSTGDYDGQKQISDQLNRNKKQNCYVDPSDPDDAVLDRSFSVLLIVLGAVAAGLILGGAAGLKFIAGAVRLEHRNRLEEQMSPSSRGITQLHPASSQLSQCLVNLLPALIWNGIVLVPVTIIAQQIRAGRPDVILILFISLFVLAGILILVQAIKKSRVLFYPTAEITLSRHPLKAGEEVDLKWNFIGQVDRISSLQIRVAAFQIPVDQVGLPQYQKFLPAWSMDLLKAEALADLRSGHRKLSIPPKVVSAEPNKKIDWAVLLVADLEKPPQLKQEFPVHVLGI